MQLWLVPSCISLTTRVRAEHWGQRLDGPRLRLKKLTSIFGFRTTDLYTETVPG